MKICGESVQHKDVAAAAAAHNARECPKKKYACNDTARGKIDYTIAPRCKAGACVAEKTPIAAPSPAPSAGKSREVDMSGFSTCQSAKDCRIVKRFPCDRCACGSDPIAAVDISRFEAAVAAVKDCPEDERKCSECKPYTADCVGGQCIAKP